MAFTSGQQLPATHNVRDQLAVCKVIKRIPQRMTGLGAFCAALNLLHRCGAQDPQISGNTPTCTELSSGVSGFLMYIYYLYIILTL